MRGEAGCEQGRITGTEEGVGAAVSQAWPQHVSGGGSLPLNGAADGVPDAARTVFEAIYQLGTCL
jgi:hypothetical protein